MAVELPWWLRGPPLAGAKPGDKTPNVEHLPTTTRKGRVVYNRKKHEFNQKDWDRLTGALFGGNADKYSKYWWEAIIQRVTLYMIDKILDKLGANFKDYEIANRVYWMLRDNLAKVFTKLSEEEKAKILEEFGYP